MFSYICSCFILALCLLDVSGLATAGCSSIDFYTGNNRAATLQDEVCSPANNFLACNYDNGRCCRSSARCVDPSSKNYNRTAAACTACTFPENPLASFCERYEGMRKCWKEHSCDESFTTEVVPPIVLRTAEQLCAQNDECRGDASRVHACFFSDFAQEKGAGSIGEGKHQPTLRLSAKCFEKTACAAKGIYGTLLSGTPSLQERSSEVTVAPERRITQTLAESCPETAACLASLELPPTGRDGPGGGGIVSSTTGRGLANVLFDSGNPGFSSGKASNRELQVTPLDCNRVTQVNACFQRAAEFCPREELLRFLSIELATVPEYLRVCFGCELESGISVEIFPDGNRVCDNIKLRAEVDYQKPCFDGFFTFFGPPGLQEYDYAWLSGSVARVLKEDDSSIETGKIFSRNRNLQLGNTKEIEFKPYESPSRRIEVRATSRFLPFFDLTKSVFLTLEKTDIVVVTNVIGTLQFEPTIDESKSFTLDGFRSCVPDRIGCEACTPEGINRGITTQEEFEFFSGFELGGLSPWRFIWAITCTTPKCALRSRSGTKYSFNLAQLSLEESPYEVKFQISSIFDATVVFESAPIEIVVNGPVVSVCAETDRCLASLPPPVGIVGPVPAQSSLAKHEDTVESATRTGRGLSSVGVRGVARRDQDLLRNSRGLQGAPSCELVRAAADCFALESCPKDRLLGFLDIDALSIPSLMESCFGCNPTGLSVSISLSSSKICDDIEVKADVGLSDNCNLGLLAFFEPPVGSAYEYTYEWSFGRYLERRLGVNADFGSTAESVEQQRRLQGEFVFPTSRAFVYKPYEMLDPTGTLRVQVAVSVLPSFQATDESVQLEESPLVVKSSVSGTIVVNATSDSTERLVIDGFRSCYPDKVGCQKCRPDGLDLQLKPDNLETFLNESGFGIVPEIWKFSWVLTCEVCEPRVFTSPELRLAVSELLADRAPYELSLTIQNVELPRLSGTSEPVQIKVVDTPPVEKECEIPEVDIISDSLREAEFGESPIPVYFVNRNSRNNVLKARLTRTDGTQIPLSGLTKFSLEWVLASRTVGKGPSLLLSDALLRVPPDLLLTFTLYARQPCTGGDDAFATINVKINLPPTSGSLAVSPASGQALQTQFQITASGWLDVDGHLPLRYVFFANGIPLRRASSNNELRDILLSGNGRVVIDAKVFDSLGAFTQTTSVVVSLSPLRLKEVDTDIFRKRSSEGADEDELLDLVGGVIEAVNDDVNSTNLTTAVEFRKQAFETIRIVQRKRRNETASTLDDVVRVATSFKKVLSKPEQLDKEDFDEFAKFFGEILEDTKDKDFNEGGGVEEQLFEDLLEGTSTLLESLVSGTSRRRLQESDKDCTNIGALRDVVTELGLVATKDDEPDLFVRTVNSTAIRLVAATSSGDAGALLTVGDVDVTVPSNLGTNTSEVTTVLSQFDFNIRLCDDPSADVLESILNPDECEETLNNSAPEGSPLKPPEFVVALEFRNTIANGGGIAVEPSDLEDPIVLRLPLGRLEEDDNGICSNFTQLACGFYSSSSGGFRTDGCNVTDVDYDSQTLECTCNHASDYAAWVAFQDDVKAVFTAPITATTLFAILLCVGLMSGVFLTYCLCFLWGNHKDKRTAAVLQKEAVGMMVMNQHLMKQRQRQFFDNLREAVKNGKSDNVVEAPAAKPKTESLCRRMWLAIQYEHSLLGLTRFDPHYTRIQRVAVFAAVIMGNLFVSALFFELKDSEIDDLSPEFVILVVLISSLAVAIPIRFIIKMVFRMSDYSAGRVTLESDRDFRLLMNNKNDMELVVAFKDVYIANEKAKQLRPQGGCCGSGGGTGAGDSEADPEEGAKQEHNDEEYTEAKRKLAAAQARLRQATISAKEDWQGRPNEVALERVKLVNRQKSRLMKIAALVAEDASPAAKSRRAICPHWVVYLSWGLILALYGLATFYVVRFVLTRADRAALPDVKRTEQELVQVWLVSASLGIFVGYCVAEPLIAVLRYALLPYCVVKYGKTNDSIEEDQMVVEAEETNEHVPEASEEEFSYNMKELRNKEDKEEAPGSQGQHSRAQYVLEFLSDLIETIY